MSTNDYGPEYFYMLKRIGRAAMYEQAAEEATEYAKACLKMARIIRGENPTPVTVEEAQANIVEEWSDQVMCARQLCVHPNADVIGKKHNRFLKRWEEAHGNDASV